MYTSLNHVAVHQKLTQHCKSTIHTSVQKCKCPGLMAGKFGGVGLCSGVSILISALEEFQGTQLLETWG